MNLKQKNIELDFSAYGRLKDELVACEKILYLLNEKINANNICIDKKIDNPYTPNNSYSDMENDLLMLKDSLEKLENARLSYNEKITDIKPIKENLRKLNNSIAYYEIKPSVENHKKYKLEKSKKEKELNLLKEDFDENEKKLRSLNEQRKNVKIAEDIINKGLQYIFFKKDRLQIKCAGESYEILSNGHSVQPKNISVGERNAIALCYFFISIMENQEEEEFYKNNNCFVIIDDPVSSFDVGNKIGILSYLRYKINRFNNGNKNSKILVMTHDLGVYYDLESIFKDLKNTKTNKFELSKHNIRKFETNKKHRDEYTVLVNNVYNYAENGDEEFEIMVGNMMRQILEAFSTFEYKKGITEISTDSDILSILEKHDSRYKEYFENLMYRLVLHGGSHRENQIHSMKDMNFFGIISPEEKQRMAKDILCYLYLLNREHLLSHLGFYDKRNINEYEETLKQWCNDILE